MKKFNPELAALNDYPEGFSNLFYLSLKLLSKTDIRFLIYKETFVQKCWRYLFIIPCLMLHYLTMGLSVVSLASTGKIVKYAYLLPPFLVTTQAIMKAFLLIFKTSSVTDILKEIGSLWRTTGLKQVQINERNSILKKVIFCNTVSYYAFIVNCTLYTMMPITEILIKKFALEQDYEMLLPFECMYPFDPTANWVVYGIVYVFQVFCTTLFVTIYLGLELFMVSLLALLGTEFTLLCEDVLKVDPEPKKNRTVVSEEINEPEFLTETSFTINNVVKRHQQLCALAARLDEAFNVMVFIDLMFVGLTTVLFIYSAQFSRGLTYSINNYAIVTSYFFNVLYFCYYGEVLSGASQRIGDMAYNNLWYKGDKEYKKTICIIIMRSQKPCYLTSMKYTPITLNLFTKVMSSTWSYLSLMNTVYAEDN